MGFPPRCENGRCGSCSTTRRRTIRSGRRSRRSRKRSAAPPKRSGSGCARLSATGSRPGLTTEERQRLKQLERENLETRRANELLKKAAAFFALAELDRRGK